MSIDRESREVERGFNAALEDPSQMPRWCRMQLRKGKSRKDTIKELAADLCRRMPIASCARRYPDEELVLIGFKRYCPVKDLILRTGLLIPERGYDHFIDLSQLFIDCFKNLATRRAVSELEPLECFKILLDDGEGRVSSARIVRGLYGLRKLPNGAGDIRGEVDEPFI